MSGQPTIDEIIDEHRSLMTATGRCLMAWATCEYHLNAMFIHLGFAEGDIAGIVWARIRGFEAKMAVLNDIAMLTFKDAESVRRDWRLLYEQSMRQYKSLTCH